MSGIHHLLLLLLCAELSNPIWDQEPPQTASSMVTCCQSFGSWAQDEDEEDGAEG